VWYAVVAIIVLVLALFGTAVWGWKANAKSRSLGASDKTKREQLEEVISREELADIVGAGPIPLTVSEQLERLRALRERLHRRRGQALPRDDVRGDG